MFRFTKSKTFIFILGLVLGFCTFLWIGNSPCYSTASIFSYFTTKFEPCNARTLSRETRKDASLILVPSATSTRVGQTFSVDLVVNPGGLDINAVGAKIIHSSSTQLMSNDESMSPFMIHLTEPFAPTDISRVAQVEPNPGITTSSTVAIFYFVALSPGTTTIILTTSSLILANDGFGTDVLGSIQNATIAVLQ
jgi:hypothetical protein